MKKAAKIHVVADATERPDGYETILVERRERVGLITLNRPKNLNALNTQLAAEMGAVLREFDADDQIGAVVVTGNPRAFAAGADIEEMADKSLVDLLASDLFAEWDQMRLIRKPVIAHELSRSLSRGKLPAWRGAF
ncbi:MAG: enoyl-CoA hydratase-related protein, partial [Pseudomonadota bacterium]